MHGHHSPIVILAKMGQRWLFVGLALFLIFNPVTWGIGLALVDHFTGSEAGRWVLGFPPAEQLAFQIPQGKIMVCKDNTCRIENAIR